MSEMDEIIREFLVESTEGLDRMDSDLVKLEKAPESRDLLGSIFRAIHTIKGTSGVLGFAKLESVAHVGENLLSLMRDGKVKPRPEITSALLAMGDMLRAFLADIESTGQERERDCAEIVARLSRLVATPGNEQKHTLLPPEATSANPATSDADASEEAGTSQEDERRNGRSIQGDDIDAKLGASAGATENNGEVRSSAAPGNIRVDVRLLDKVMNLVGELVLARNQVLQFTATQKDPGFLSTTQRLNLITTELQEGVMKTRMQPIGNVWNKFPRLVRDLAIACGKRVRIELEGSDTELDKTIIEAIKDPLTHVVRNAIDHGIEAPEIRKAAGKGAEGRLLLRAFHEGGHVNIEITDDGSGIDLQRVKQKALLHGLVPADHLARMGERELVNLLFLPGFSTAEKVTNVSGRGVGMDVVKTNVEKIGGTVDVNSVAGQGTTLKIKIPLTLAIIPALIVTSGAERYAIPQISLLELVRLEGADSDRAIESIQGVPVYRLRGNLLPVVFLNRELGVHQSPGGTLDAVNIVVLQADGRQFGLVVDEINDTEEIVVKPLGKHLKGLSCFAGATIMGDGRVALIIDVLGVAQRASVVSEARDGARNGAATGIEAQKADRQQWLLFTLGDQGRMAVPLSAVARLEEIGLDAVEKAGTHDVVQYRGQIMPLVSVAEALNVMGAPPRDPMQVIVYTQDGRSVGLVVNEILDVVEQTVEQEGKRVRAGLRGSAVIQQHVTDLVDVQQLVAAAGHGTAAEFTAMEA
jgi:two-component system chemotaxis sensor kinase CheA